MDILLIQIIYNGWRSLVSLSQIMLTFAILVFVSTICPYRLLLHPRLMRIALTRLGQFHI